MVSCKCFLIKYSVGTSGFKMCAIVYKLCIYISFHLKCLKFILISVLALWPGLKWAAPVRQDQLSPVETHIRSAWCALMKPLDVIMGCSPVAAARFSSKEPWRVSLQDTHVLLIVAVLTVGLTQWKVADKCFESRFIRQWTTKELHILSRLSSRIDFE